MHLSTHYYVLSLSPTVNTLFEAFRDYLINVQNQGFPVVAPDPPSDRAGDDRLRDLARAVDERFAHYYALGPLGLVLVGDRAMQSAFDAVTVHGIAVVGRVYGDNTATSADVLGPIVWPVVKEKMSRVLEAAMRDLGTCETLGQTVAGIEAVARETNHGATTTLLLEDDYHVCGTIRGSRDSPVITPDVDVRETMDDVVDEVIEGVLRSGGRVMFTPAGSLSRQRRIVLMIRDTKGT